MSTKKKQPQKDTSIEEIDLLSFDMDAINTPPAPIASSASTPEPKKALSQRERDTFDDHAIPPDESNPDTEEDPVIKDEFDDDFEDPFDDDDDAPEK